MCSWNSKNLPFRKSGEFKVWMITILWWMNERIKSYIFLREITRFLFWSSCLEIIPYITVSHVPSSAGIVTCVIEFVNNFDVYEPLVTNTRINMTHKLSFAINTLHYDPQIYWNLKFQLNNINDARIVLRYMFERRS